jgi:hypothetical protein
MQGAPAGHVATSAEEAARIPARAEFRVFGQGIIENVKARMWNGRTVLQQAREMPPEIYFLSRRTSDANVKVRDGLLDIKARIAETPEGYEVFQPRGKFEFPVGRDELAAILSQLKVEHAVDREVCDLDTFLAMARRHPDLAVVTVRKVRYGFTLDGVTCEYAQVYFNGAMLESACVESEDHGAMRGVIEALGLSSLANVSYVKAAKMVVGMA